MPEKTEIKNTERQKFSKTAKVINLVAAVDHIFNKLEISESSIRNPSAQNDRIEKLAGMTNTYLHPTRISRKLVLWDAVFFYGRKFNLLPEIYETIPYDAPADVFSFVKNRIKETLTDYMSIHKGNQRLNLDVKDGVITSLFKIGFDGHFTYLSKNKVLTVGNLEKIIRSLLEKP